MGSSEDRCPTVAEMLGWSEEKRFWVRVEVMRAVCAANGYTRQPGEAETWALALDMLDEHLARLTVEVRNYLGYRYCVAVGEQEWWMANRQQLGLFYRKAMLAALLGYLQPGPEGCYLETLPALHMLLRSALDGVAIRIEKMDLNRTCETL